MKQNLIVLVSLTRGLELPGTHLFGGKREAVELSRSLFLLERKSESGPALMHLNGANWGKPNLLSDPSILVGRRQKSKGLWSASCHPQPANY